MTRRRLPCEIIAAALVALAAPGCGGGEAASDPAARYSPESLAGELVFRYKALDPARRNAPKARPAAPSKAATKAAKAETKAAQAATLDDLVRETGAKAATIPGLARAEALAKVAEAVGKDASVAEADRKVIAERLQAEAGAKSAAID